MVAVPVDVDVEVAITVNGAPFSVGGSDHLDERVGTLEASFARLVEGLTTTAMPWFGSLQARDEVRCFVLDVAGTGDDLRVNDETINPATGAPFGSDPGGLNIVFQRAVVTVWRDGVEPTAFRSGWDFLDLVATVAGSTYHVVAVEPIASTPAPAIPDNGPPPAEG